MPKIFLPRGLRFWTVVVAASLLVPSLGQGATTTPTADLTTKVKVVKVVKKGTSLQVTPTKVQVKQKAEIVVWVTDGLALKIEFKKTNPFPDVTCPGGQFCGALLPSSAAPGVYDYKVTVDGIVIDPNVEVVK
jgi:hypothetical protein